jgi:hypothetical protein
MEVSKLRILESCRGRIRPFEWTKTVLMAKEQATGHPIRYIPENAYVYAVR